ncbi:MAG: single-stranded DNA-binding protein [Treponema sp.]|nr:single-stranded DNA-binding protein [Treponema sp.]
MTDLNETTIHGRVVRNAEFSMTDSGLKIARFAIAVNKSRRLENGEYEDDVSFFPLVVFGEYAERVWPYLVKGRGITVKGHLKQNRWEKDGQKRSEIAICVEHLYWDQIATNPSVQVQKTVNVPVQPVQQGSMQQSQQVQNSNTGMPVELYSSEPWDTEDIPF